jgi:hypothetical protein
VDIEGKMDLPHEQQEEMMDASLMHPSLSIIGEKRLFSDELDMSFHEQDDDRPIPKKKGRKKSFIWSHVVTDENGKVHCLHCGMLIRVNIGEKVNHFSFSHRNESRVDVLNLYYLLLCVGGKIAQTFCQIMSKNPISKRQQGI